MRKKGSRVDSCIVGVFPPFFSGWRGEEGDGWEIWLVGVCSGEM